VEIEYYDAEDLETLIELLESVKRPAPEEE